MPDHISGKLLPVDVVKLLLFFLKSFTPEADENHIFKSSTIPYTLRFLIQTVHFKDAEATLWMELNSDATLDILAAQSPCLV